MEIKTCETCGRQHTCLNEEERKAAEAGRAERDAATAARMEPKIETARQRMAAERAGTR